MEFSVVRSQNRYLVPLFYWAKEGSSFLYWFWRLFQASLSWCSHIRLLFRNLCFFVCLFYYYYYYYKFSFLFFLIGSFGVRFFSPSYRALLLLFFFLSCVFFSLIGGFRVFISSSKISPRKAMYVAVNCMQDFFRCFPQPDTVFVSTSFFYIKNQLYEVICGHKKVP